MIILAEAGAASKCIMFIYNTLQYISHKKGVGAEAATFFLPGAAKASK
jgi:hypothetical protein